MPRSARQPLRVGPPTIAVHHDGHMLRNELLRNIRRPRARRMRGRRNRGNCHDRSTNLNERTVRSKCHCTYAATNPSASRRQRTLESSAKPQSPINKAPNNMNVSGEGDTDPGGRHTEHTAPPEITEKLRCGPSAPQRAQCEKLGAQPPTANARRRYEFMTKSGSWRRCDNAAKAPARRRNCCEVASSDSVRR